MTMKITILTLSNTREIAPSQNPCYSISPNLLAMLYVETVGKTQKQQQQISPWDYILVQLHMQQGAELDTLFCIWYCFYRYK